jgi:hypothetical protein
MIKSRDLKTMKILPKPKTRGRWNNNSFPHIAIATPHHFHVTAPPLSHFRNMHICNQTHSKSSITFAPDTFQIINHIHYVTHTKQSLHRLDRFPPVTLALIPKSQS